MNIPLLEYEMKRKGVTKDEMCKVLGISHSTFYRKCTGKSEFKLEELVIIRNLLNLPDVTPIFFGD